MSKSPGYLTIVLNKSKHTSHHTSNHTTKRLKFGVKITERDESHSPLLLPKTHNNELIPEICKCTFR